MRYLISLLLTFTFYTYADDHGSEADVLSAVEKYYAARTARDFETMGKLFLKIDLQFCAIILCSFWVPWADLKWM